jgi:putative ABC transport system permease protein
MKHSQQMPPKLFLRFFRWYCHPRLVDHIEGDLLEEYGKRVDKHGKRNANLRYIIDVLLLFRPAIIKSFKGNENVNTLAMYRSYLKIAWRDLAGNKVFSLIKIMGLSLGLTTCMLIVLYTKDEFTFDQFHENKGQLYRIVQTMKFGDFPEQTIAITTPYFGEAFSKEIPEVEQYVRVNGATVTVRDEGNTQSENTLLVDENFLSVFTFPLLYGNKEAALKDPHNLVLSEDKAKQYFGTTDVIGKTMELKLDTAFENFIVTAVAKNPFQNSSLKFDMLLPMPRVSATGNENDWIGGSLNTFLFLSPLADAKTVVDKMQALFDNKTKAFTEKMEKEHGVEATNKLSLQPLTDVHLSEKAGPWNGMSDGSKPIYSYVLTCIAVFILIVACINFVNLAAAQSLRRSKEIGIRKVVGGTRKQLIRQFLTESFLTSGIAFILAFSLTTTTLPYFNDLVNKKLSLAYLADGYLYSAFFLLLLGTSFLAGSYPAFSLSSFQPVKALKERQKLMGKNYLTRGLIVLQFALSIFLIIGTVAINSQLDFFMQADLGYDRENLLRIDLPSNQNSDKIAAAFKNELTNRSNILSVAARSGGRNTSAVKVEEKQIIVEYDKIDDQYLLTFKIQLTAGRNFLPDHPSDVMAVIVNESFVKEAGWKGDEAVGKTIKHFDERSSTVIGVTKDYHFASLKEKIMPKVFSMDPNVGYAQMWIKISPTNIPETLKLLENTFKKFVPYFPYAYHFMNDLYEEDYKSEGKWKQIITIASGLFFFISCIGLFGLVTLSIEQRTKEIGIRKVLGAALSSIVIVISKEFVILTTIGFLVAIPTGYYFADLWLQSFPYRISLDWWIFVKAGAFVIAFAALTTALQAMRAGVSNPVKSLRSE